MSHQPVFVVVWEFRVVAGQEARFEQLYGSDGPWLKLFRRSPDFRRTELVRDLATPVRYWTLDYWASEAVYNYFRTQHAAEYLAIDQQAEKLTEKEVELGRFVLLT